MPHITDYTEELLLKHLCLDEPMEQVATYMALFTDFPGRTGTISAEVSGAGYARVLVRPNDQSGLRWTLPGLD